MYRLQSVYIGAGGKCILLNFSHLSHSSHVQTRKLCSSKYSKGKNMFSSFLLHERRRPPLSAGVALPTAQYHNCVVFDISVERTEHALNNILYRESPLHRNYRKAKGKLSVLKIFPASVFKDGNQGIVQITKCVYCTCLYQLRSSWK